MKITGNWSLLGNIFFASLATLVFASTSFAVFPPIDDKDTVVLYGNVHPLARPEFDKGKTDPSLRMERMILTLRLSASRQAELDKLLAGLHDPASPDYRQWLTPEEFGRRFAITATEIKVITDWLTAHGFVVDEVARGRAWINFSGSVADVENAFHTEIHNYYVKGRLYHANSNDPSIPRALADVVAGIVSLHNFPRKMMHNEIVPVQPDYTSGSAYYLSPGDFSTIYNVNTAYNAGINGSSQSIAIVGRTHPSPAVSDWASFRSMMGLPANPPRIIINGTDPGDLGTNEDIEADLDVEWSGAVAKNASILFVASKSTASTDGVDLSAQYIVNNNLAPVMSTSFGSCEQDMTPSENNFWKSLWAQAASQGITSFVSSGDAGAAGCNTGSDYTGSILAVNGLASTPSNVAVGGTEFNEGSGTYWNTTNGTGYTSALSYIPEVAWNESRTAGGSDLWATGGGASIKYPKPLWQVSPGVPADNARDIPDVSLSAAGHDAYLVEMNGSLYAVSGTSASAPSFAGLMALITQKTGQRQGNANTRFYQLGNAQYGPGGAAVFHDITSGNNSVPGVTGYTCAAGYSLVTGLGSVDANALVNNWVPDFTILASPATVSVNQSATGTSTINTTVSGDFSNAVTLSASGLPSGATAAFNPAAIPSPGAGASTMTITAGASSPPGVYAVTITGSGGGVTHTAAMSLTIIQVFTVTASTTNGTGGTITPPTSSAPSGSTVTLTITANSGYTLGGLTDNGTSVAATQGSPGNYTYTIYNISSNHTVNATFSQVSSTVSGPALGPWVFLLTTFGLGWVLKRREKNRQT